MSDSFASSSHSTLSSSKGEEKTPPSPVKQAADSPPTTPKHSTGPSFAPATSVPAPASTQAHPPQDVHTIPSAPVSPEKEIVTTRILTADQFRRIYQSDIAPNVHAPETPGRHQQSAPSSRPTTGGPQRPTSGGQGSARHHVMHSRKGRDGFIDPFGGTRYSRGMQRSGSRPQSPPKAPAKLKAMVRGGAHAGNASSWDRSQQKVLPDDDQLLKLEQTLKEVKLNLALRDKRIHQLTKDNHKLEAEISQNEAKLHSRNKAPGESDKIEKIILALKARSTFLEEKLRATEEELHVVSNSSKTTRICDLKAQCETYLAEVRRLQEEVRVRDLAEKRGLEGAALSEAHAIINSKDAQLAASNEKLRQLRIQVSAAQAEAEYLRSHHDRVVLETESFKKKVEEIKDAPAEILRLRQKLSEMETKLSAAEANPSRAMPEGQTSTVLVHERDQLMVRVAQLEATLRQTEQQCATKISNFDLAVKQAAADGIKKAEMLAGDRERALQEENRDLAMKAQELKMQLENITTNHQTELKTLRTREEQRQQELLKTMGTYDQERNERQLRAMEELRATQDALTREREQLATERRQWEIEQQRCRSELEAIEEEARQRNEALRTATAAIPAPNTPKSSKSGDSRLKTVAPHPFFPPSNVEPIQKQSLPSVSPQLETMSQANSVGQRSTPNFQTPSGQSRPNQAPVSKTTAESSVSSTHSLDQPNRAKSPVAGGRRDTVGAEVPRYNDDTISEVTQYHPPRSVDGDDTASHASVLHDGPGPETSFGASATITSDKIAPPTKNPVDQQPLKGTPVIVSPVNVSANNVEKQTSNQSGNFDSEDEIDQVEKKPLKSAALPLPRTPVIVSPAPVVPTVEPKVIQAPINDLSEQKSEATDDALVRGSSSSTGAKEQHSGQNATVEQPPAAQQMNFGAVEALRSNEKPIASLDITPQTPPKQPKQNSSDESEPTSDISTPKEGEIFSSSSSSESESPKLTQTKKKAPIQIGKPPLQEGPAIESGEKAAELVVSANTNDSAQPSHQSNTTEQIKTKDEHRKTVQLRLALLIPTF